MPELPEVATTIKQVFSEMANQEVIDLSSTNEGERQLNIPFVEAKARLVGTKLTSLDRHGKWMLFDFGAAKVVGHLRMSGRYNISNKVLTDKHNRFQFHLENGKVINYLDQRRFGTFHFVEDFKHHSGLSNLGLDALDENLSVEYLKEKLRNKKKPIYSALLDQSTIAGLGNIYVNEILHASKIHLLQPANTLDTQHIVAIISNIKTILARALELKGTTLIDKLYQDPDGKTGEFAKLLQVYGQKKNPEIEVIKIGGRSGFVHKNTKLFKVAE